jgi:hypothetical protein
VVVPSSVVGGGSTVAALAAGAARSATATRHARATDRGARGTGQPKRDGRESTTAALEPHHPRLHAERNSPPGSL